MRLQTQAHHNPKSPPSPVWHLRHLTCAAGKWPPSGGAAGVQAAAQLQTQRAVLTCARVWPAAATPAQGDLVLGEWAFCRAHSMMAYFRPVPRAPPLLTNRPEPVGPQGVHRQGSQNTHWE